MNIDEVHSLDNLTKDWIVLPQTMAQYYERLTTNAAMMDNLKIRRQLVSYLRLTLKKLDGIRDQSAVPILESSRTNLQEQMDVDPVPGDTNVASAESSSKEPLSVPSGNDLEDGPLSTRSKIENGGKTKKQRKLLSLPGCREVTVRILILVPISRNDDRVPPTGTDVLTTSGADRQ